MKKSFSLVLAVLILGSGAIVSEADARSRGSNDRFSYRDRARCGTNYGSLNRWEAKGLRNERRRNNRLAHRLRSDGNFSRWDRGRVFQARRHYNNRYNRYSRNGF